MVLFVTIMTMANSTRSRWQRLGSSGLAAILLGTTACSPLQRDLLKSDVEHLGLTRAQTVSVDYNASKEFLDMIDRYHAIIPPASKQFNADERDIVGYLSDADGRAGYSVERSREGLAINVFHPAKQEKGLKGGEKAEATIKPIGTDRSKPLEIRFYDPNGPQHTLVGLQDTNHDGTVDKKVEYKGGTAYNRTEIDIGNLPVSERDRLQTIYNNGLKQLMLVISDYVSRRQK